MAKNDFPKPTPAAPYPLGHAKENKDASAYTGFKYPSGGTGNDLNVYKQPMPNPGSLDIEYSQDPNKLKAQELNANTGRQRVSAGDPGSKVKNRHGEITIRGCGAATKGTKARGPMA
ncbi:MAG: hypothetical protein F2774_03970 [Actinobacteria bacterium]|uniref:Unannotated protein n=1 Tax=freshwater metagenome TaxID=449393 RepID=A0A6J7BT22_9ZZZZ|nr:hypothetical protein [Actinomycetota bacterium]